MKKQYKEFITNYLNNSPSTTAYCRSIGWSGFKFGVNHEMPIRATNRVSDVLPKNDLIEHVLIHKLITEKLGNNFSSYDVTYNKETKKFEGTYKERKHGNNMFLLNIPENLWFDNVIINIYVQNKKTVRVDFTTNLKNGFYPENIKEIINKIKNDISTQLLNYIKNLKGKVDARYIRSFNFSKTYSLDIEIGSLEYVEKKVNISIS